MSIDQRTAASCLQTVLRRVSHFHIAIPRVCANYQTRQTLSTVGSQSRSLPFKISANIAIHRSVFLPILILKRIHSLSIHLIIISLKPSYTIWHLCSYFHPYTGSRMQSRPTRTFKLSHLHVLRSGALIKNKVQHTAVLQLLYDAYTPKG